MNNQPSNPNNAGWPLTPEQTTNVQLPTNLNRSRPDGKVERVQAGPPEVGAAVCFLQDINGNVRPNPSPCNVPNYHVHALQVLHHSQQAGFADQNEAHKIYRASVRELAFSRFVRLVLWVVVGLVAIPQLEQIRQFLLGLPGLSRPLSEFIMTFNAGYFLWGWLALTGLSALRAIVTIIIELGTHLEVRKLDAVFLLHRPHNWMFWETNIVSIQFTELQDCDIVRRNSLFGTQKLQFNFAHHINLPKAPAEKIFALAQAILIQNRNSGIPIVTFRF